MWSSENPSAVGPLPAVDFFQIRQLLSMSYDAAGGAPAVENGLDLDLSCSLICLA